MDHCIIHALRIDGRAPFSRIAEVLGVSTQTVARRYGRLSSELSLRVVGVANPRQSSAGKWILRLTASPNTAQSVAYSLARRDDTTWVRLVSGGTEICFVMNSAAHHTLLFREIPRVANIAEVSAHRLLHNYLGGPTAWQGHTSALTKEQQEQLRRGLDSSDEADEPKRSSLTQADWQLLAALQNNGRISYTDLAAETGQSSSTITRRLAALQASGMLTFDVEISAEVYGITTQALLWMSVAPAHLNQVANTLIQHKELAFLASTTGPTNLVALVLCKSPSELHDYLADSLSMLDSIRMIETSPVQRTLKSCSPFLHSSPRRSDSA
ncbi:Lrp/AsnC family transcriptional regulator [Streptomyces sp. STR69]|uniref:Lrp/AsnC family transcriptional regulator n=1 Tax=Streptomyces sp. STR69 TaxID=1796942 RepID=UPI0021C64B66|nr:AsnC family transcriptional regulator [Streptomyces sp. STR69]